MRELPCLDICYPLEEYVGMYVREQLVRLLYTDPGLVAGDVVYEPVHDRGLPCRSLPRKHNAAVVLCGIDKVCCRPWREHLLAYQLIRRVLLRVLLPDMDAGGIVRIDVLGRDIEAEPDIFERGGVGEMHYRLARIYRGIVLPRKVGHERIVVVLRPEPDTGFKALPTEFNADIVVGIALNVRHERVIYKRRQHVIPEHEPHEIIIELLCVIIRLRVHGRDVLDDILGEILARHKPPFEVRHRHRLFLYEVPEQLLLLIQEPVGFVAYQPWLL